MTYDEPNTPTRRRLKAYWKMILMLGLLLIALSLALQFYLMSREKNPVINEATQYLNPLPPTFDLKPLVDLYDQAQNTTPPVEEFINSLDKNKINIPVNE